MLKQLQIYTEWVSLMQSLPKSQRSLLAWLWLATAMGIKTDDELISNRLKPMANLVTTPIEVDSNSKQTASKVVSNSQKTHENSKQTRMKPPSLDVVKSYARLKNFKNVDCEKFFAYYQANGWQVGRNPMKDWRYALAYWERGNKQSDGQREQAESKASRAEAAARYFGDFNQAGEDEPTAGTLRD